MLAHASLPLSFLSYAFTTAIYLVNCLPIPILHQNSPYECLFHEPPSYEYLHVFGYSYFPFIRPYNQHKLQSRSLDCIFLGYNSYHKGYICFHQPIGRIYLLGTLFSMKLALLMQLAPPFISANQPHPHLFPFLSIPSSPPTNPSSTHPTSQSSPTNSTPPSPLPPSTSSSQTLNPSPCPVTTSRAPCENLPPPQQNVHPMIIRSKAGIFKPKLLLSHCAMNIVEPQSYKQACSIPEWQATWQQEITALHRNNTWHLLPSPPPPPPPHAIVIDCKWVYIIKLKTDGYVELYKACLVAKGYNQTEELDYFETFSPIVKPTSIRIVLALALSNQWPIKQLDVHKAFLNDTLTEDVFMSLPSGFLDAKHPHFICKLNKAIYNLKQSPRAWYLKRSNSLHQWSFHGSRACAETRISITYCSCACRRYSCDWKLSSFDYQAYYSSQSTI